MRKRQHKYYTIEFVDGDFYIFHYHDDSPNDKRAERDFLLNNYFDCREEAMAARDSMLMLMNRPSPPRGHKKDRYWYIYKYQDHYNVTSKIDIWSNDDTTRWRAGNYFYCKEQAMKTLQDGTLVIEPILLDDSLPW